MPERNLGTGPEAAQLMDKLLHGLTEGKGKITESQEKEETKLRKRVYVTPDGKHIFTIEERLHIEQVIIFPKEIGSQVREIVHNLTYNPYEGW